MNYAMLKIVLFVTTEPDVFYNKLLQHDRNIHSYY